MNHLLKALLVAQVPHAEQEFKWMQQAASNIEELSSWVQKRIAGEPLNYILQNCPFRDLMLHVDSRVLIPRFETEQLVELVLATLPINKKVTLVDLGCGSGAIALAIKLARPLASVIAIDASAAALEVALINQQRYPDSPVTWLQSNWLDCIDLNQIDIIISNPPYIEASWTHSSIKHEPASALFSGADGLDDIRYILSQISGYHHLKIWFEHGHAQDLSTLISPPWQVKQYQDLAKNNRFTYFDTR